MFLNYDIRSIPLSSRWCREQAEAFLVNAGLSLDTGLEHLAGIYDTDDRLVGCGGLQGNTIKCLALSEELRGQNVGATLVSKLYSLACDNGHSYVNLFTKPENRDMFTLLGFRLIGQADKAVMMQSMGSPLSTYLDYLRKLPRGEHNGVLVMNVNPLTLGHKYLIEQAASRCDFLTIIPVADNPSTLYSYAERRAMLLAACAGLANVTVAEGSEYVISAATFPTYFIKEKSEAARAHIELDLDIFCRHIAPALGASVRFVGSEPLDPLTALYNEQMHRRLPSAGIGVVELPRLELSGVPVSASRIRALTEQGRVHEAMQLVPATTLPYLLATAATFALQDELDLTPKPGLVDRHDSGAHADMDHALMSLSIRTLHPYLSQMAAAAATIPLPALRESLVNRLREIGIEAEKAMLAATGGVNTHRGAIFAMGLMLSAATALSYSSRLLSPSTLSTEIAALAALIPTPRGTHGAMVAGKEGCSGALAQARSGYAALFADWLPAYRKWLATLPTEEARLRTLLLIISSLPDSCALYRAGADIAELSRKEAEDVLHNFSLTALDELNIRFSARGISHGGAADMLALTMLAHSILPLEINNQQYNLN